MFLSLFIVIFTLSANADASVDMLKEAIGKFQSANAVKTKVRKTAFYSLLDETKKSEGEMIFSKGQLRLDLSKAEDPSLIVMTDSTIWVETPNAWGDGKHVMKIVSKDLQKRSKAPIAMLLKQKDVLDLFKLDSSKKDGDATLVTLKPKNKDSFSELAEVTLKVSDKNDLQTLSYKDEIENTVTYEFLNPDMKYKTKKSDFDYKPPKGAEITPY